MSSTARDLRQEFDKLIADKMLLVNERSKNRRKIKKLRREAKAVEQARLILIEITKLTQSNFKKHVETLVTMAIQAVFARPFEFVIQFYEHSNKTLAKPIIIEDGEEFSPKDDNGGGLLDIIGVALRIVLWTLEIPRSRNVFIFDEPFRFIGTLMTKAGMMLKHLSHKLQFQVILVTNDWELIDISDRAWRVRHGKKHSTIEVIKNNRVIIRRRK